VVALHGDAEQLHNRALLYLGQFFTALTDDSPAVILLEDLHWADGGSLNGLVDLCRRRPGLPLFILCLTRPGLLVRRPGWGSDLLETRYEQIDLAPLAETEARALVVEILQRVTQVPPIVAEGGGIEPGTRDRGGGLRPIGRPGGDAADPRGTGAILAVAGLRGAAPLVGRVRGRVS
jgi:hypothetical protein